VNPPLIAGIPNEQVQGTSDVRYGPVWFVVGDLNNAGVDDAVLPNGNSNITFDDPPPSSDNPFLVPADAIHVDQILNMNGRTFQVTVNPVYPLFGRAGITITAKDPDGNRTSTSFVLDVTDPNHTNTPPSFMPSPSPSPSGSYIEHNVTNSPYIDYNFQVTDSETQKNQLLVTAVSSNAKLVPNDTSHLTVSSISTTGTGTLKITPVLPLPSPSPGVPQAATITLSVTDDAYTRRMQFLYVAKNPTSKALFGRPRGVYNLDPDTTQHRPDDAFLTGEMRQISWKDIDKGPDPWDWTSLDNAFTEVYQDGKDLSINLIDEPCDVAEAAQYTWCDINRTGSDCNYCENESFGTIGVLRALPWDTYLQQRRQTFLKGLAAHVLLASGNTVANEPLIPIINFNLPGGNNGIRELNMVPFSSLEFEGYTRDSLLTAIQT
jgi:hypothetical protein